MEPNVFDKVHEVDLKKTMEQSYIDYAMSVISARALPDVRDGLKPVQRRVLYSMIELNNGPDKPHRKCARIVGDTMGKYHPHGDSSIYGALVNMAQEWSTRYPLVDGHGNFGSVDGDGAAAMRYTEARLSKISMEMLADINKDTVDFVPNFDETEREPLVLPSRYPNLLVNGTSGIAVGMATNIPPHNLREIIGAVVKMIDNRVEEDRETSLEEIMEIVKGPDFPTGATILGRRGIEEAYRTGRAKIKVRAVTNIETMANGKSRIIAVDATALRFRHRHHCGQAVHEVSVPFFRWYAPCRRMGLNKISLIFQGGHIITDGGRADAQIMIFGQGGRTDWLLRANIVLDDGTQHQHTS